MPESDSQQGVVRGGRVWQRSFHIGWNVSWARRVIYGLHGPTLRPDVNDMKGALFQLVAGPLLIRLPCKPDSVRRGGACPHSRSRDLAAASPR